MPSSSLFLRSSTTFVSALALLSAPVAAAPTSQVYNIDTTYAGPSFFSGWNFFADADPTHGFVTYLSQSQAQSEGLISAGSSAQMRVDSKTLLPVPASKDAYWGKNGVGRKSVRIESQKSWTHGLFIADLNHMPTSSDAGCGTWPAFWSLGSGPWPNNGEIDIIEGANDQSANTAAGHTANQCAINNQGGSGELLYSNCNYNSIDPWGNAKNPTGCQVGSTSQQSYGAGFNAGGGGAYAMEWTSQAVKIWFFPRGSYPSDLNSANPNPANWPQPFSLWTGAGCDLDQNYEDLRLIFDTTFCGDFGDATWSAGTCASRTRTTQCDAYVARNPGAFAQAYWDVNYVKVYQLGAAQVTTTTTTTTKAATTTTAVITTTSQYGNYTRPVPPPPGTTTTTTTTKKIVDPWHTDPSKPWEDSDEVDPDHTDPSKPWEDSDEVDPDHTDPSKPWEDSDEADPAHTDPSKPWKDSDEADPDHTDPSKPWEDSDEVDPDHTNPSKPWTDATSPEEDCDCDDDPTKPDKWTDNSNSDTPSPADPAQPWTDNTSPAPADPAQPWADTPSSPTHTAYLEPAGQAWSDSNTPAAPADPAQQWSDAPVAPASSEAVQWSDVPVAPTSAVTIKVVPTAAAETWADVAATPVAPAEGGAAKPTAAPEKGASPYTGGATREVLAYGVLAVVGVVGAFLL